MFGALVYNQNKVDSEEAKVLFSNKSTTAIYKKQIKV